MSFGFGYCFGYFGKAFTFGLLVFGFVFAIYILIR